MSLEQVPAYRTSDGEVFTDSVEAELHENEARNVQLIDSYVKSKVDNPRNVTRARNIISDFFKYLAEIGVAMPQLPAEMMKDDAEVG